MQIQSEDAVSMLKVTTILGTRPEIIRLSRVMARLDEHTEHRIVHTGQNWDYELNEVFFSDLDVRKPDNFLGVDTSSLGAVLGGILIETEKELKTHRPDALLVLGDTNSAIAAIMARRMKIPVYHMEAGNRSFDRNVPEETNRRLGGALSRLPYRYRLVIELRHFQAFSNKQVSSYLELSEKAASKLYMRAIEKLRVAMACE